MFTDGLCIKSDQQLLVEIDLIGVQTFEVDLGTKPKLRRQFAFNVPPFHNVHTVRKTGHPSK